MLLGHSLTLQISGGEIVLGQWQRILMAELDGPRARTLRVQIFGSAYVNGRCSQHSGSQDIADKSRGRERLSFEDGVRLFDARICSRSAGWPTASASGGMARAPTSITTCGSRRPTSAKPHACSARSRGCGRAIRARTR